MEQTEQTLTQLMAILPQAKMSNRLDDWASLYTQGYMLKMRAMR
jgi:hypothetical protein